MQWISFALVKGKHNFKLCFNFMSCIAVLKEATSTCLRENKCFEGRRQLLFTLQTQEGTRNRLVSFQCYLNGCS